MIFEKVDKEKGVSFQFINKDSIKRKQEATHKKQTYQRSAKFVPQLRYEFGKKSV